MNRFLQLCVDGKTLTAGEAETLMNMMMAAEMTPSEMGGYCQFLLIGGRRQKSLRVL
ncbi:Anthranilate phosphoribosyltransferase [Bacillus subtilis]|nr:Anthranilate phosphoribosyltransferase [Bacillus subtilis]